VTVAGQNVTVTQSYCTVSFNPVSDSATASGKSGSIAVSAPSGCPWNGASDSSWLTVNSGSGTGSGTISYTVAANGSSSGRTGTITAPEASFVANQAGTAAAVGPTLTSPANQSTIKLPEIFSWSGGGPSYVLQIAANSSFSPVTLQYTTSSQSIIVPDSGTLPLQTPVYWRVGTAAGIGGNLVFSAVRQFQVGSGQPPLPAAPTRIAPSDGQTTSGSSATFSWQAQTGATRYRLVIATDQTFSKAVETPDLTETQFTWPLPAGTYVVYWKVRGGNSTGLGEYSTAGSFPVANSSVLSSAVIDSPPEGTSVDQGVRLTISARFTGTYGGTVSGYWLIDGARTDFSFVRRYPEQNTVTILAPTDRAGAHSVEVIVERPVQVRSTPRNYTVRGVFSTATRLRVWSESNAVPADAIMGITKIFAEVVDGQGRVVPENGRTVQFEFVGASFDAFLSGTSATVTAGRASTTLIPPIQPALLTIRATASGLDGATVSISVGAAAMKSVALQYLDSLQALTLPRIVSDSRIFASPVFYRVSNLRQRVEALDASNPAQFPMLVRLMLVGKVLYHFYGVGAPAVPSDNGPWRVGASQMAKDLAIGAVSTAATIWSLVEFGKHLQLAKKAGGPQTEKVLEDLTKSIFAAQSTIANQLLDTVTQWGDPDLGLTLRLAIDSLKDAIEVGLTGENPTAVVETVLKTFAEQFAESSIAAYYVNNTQSVLDAANSAALSSSSSPSDPGVVISSVNTSIQMASERTASADIKSQAYHEVGENFSDIGDLVGSAGALAKVTGIGAIITYGIELTAKAYALWGQFVAVREPYREIGRLRDEARSVVPLLFPGFAATATATKRTNDPARGALAPRAAVASDALSASADLILRYSAQAQRAVAAVSSGNQNELTGAVTELSATYVQLADQITLVMATLRCYAPQSIYNSKTFAEEYQATAESAQSLALLQVDLLTTLSAIVVGQPGSTLREAVSPKTAALLAMAARFQHSAAGA
ncbi:MAG: BACON domain-containing protein, partial [Acidobacteria bacterium]|nr:BACON domain-containing protein [Acidobacteriota bacterium]